jgi:hypothetical protein
MFIKDGKFAIQLGVTSDYKNIPVPNCDIPVQ